MKRILPYVLALSTFVGSAFAQPRSEVVPVTLGDTTVQAHRSEGHTVNYELSVGGNHVSLSIGGPGELRGWRWDDSCAVLSVDTGRWTYHAIDKNCGGGITQYLYSNDDGTWDGGTRERGPGFSMSYLYSQLRANPHINADITARYNSRNKHVRPTGDATLDGLFGRQR